MRRENRDPLEICFYQQIAREKLHLLMQKYLIKSVARCTQLFQIKVTTTLYFVLILACFHIFPCQLCSFHNLAETQLNKDCDIK